MRYLKSHLIGVDQGSELLFSDFQDGGAMWTGQGKREYRRTCQFKHPFATPPTLQVSMSMWDMDRRANQRADLSAENVTAEGFDIVFRTWGDTRIARVRADWMAIGPVEGDEDDWALY